MTRKAIRITAAGIVVTILAAAALYRTLGYAAAVETVPAAEGAVPVTIKGPGTVEARIPVTLSARVTATVTKLHADQGDAVKRGQLVATLDDRDLAAKRAGSVQRRKPPAATWRPRRRRSQRPRRSSTSRARSIGATRTSCARATSRSR